MGFSLFVSFFLAIINKLIPASTFYFDYPLLVTCIQQLTTLLCVLIHIHYSRTETQRSSLIIKKSVIVDVFPLALIFVVMVGLSALCREYVEATFQQVLRGFSLFNTLALTYMESTSSSRTNMSKLMMITFVLMVGTWLGSSSSEYSLAPVLVFGLPYSFSFSLYLLYIKKTLALVDSNVWTLMAYHSSLSLLLFLPLAVASKEVYFLWTRGFSFKSATWLSLLCLGFEGYLITLFTNFQIKYTSPFASNVWFLVKSQLQLVALMLLWNNAISAQAALGIAATAFGALLCWNV